MMKPTIGTGRANRFQGVLVFAAAAMLLTLLSGCAAGYTLKGKVVRGGFTEIEIVSSDDEDFDEAGVADVRIMIHRDPNTLKQALIATGKSKSDGTFSIAVDAFGAGWMEETWLIQVERGGYLSGNDIIRLPGMGQRLLITVSEGTSVPHQQRENLWQQYEQYK